MKSKEYELLVREIYQQILNQGEVQNVVVEHNVLKQGISTKHQIDVYWEFVRGGVTHKVAVQAKNWKQPVNQGTMFNFKAVLDDLPGTSGVMVTAGGYQQGALEVAKTYGIIICELKEEPAAAVSITVGTTIQLEERGVLTTAGRPYAIAMRHHFTKTELSDWTVLLDPKQSREDIPDLAKSKIPFTEIEVLDGDGNLLCNLHKIHIDMLVGLSSEVQLGEVEDRKTYVFDGPAFLRHPSLSQPLMVKGVSAKTTVSKWIEDSEWKLNDVAVFILKNLTHGGEHRFAAHFSSSAQPS